MPIYEFYCPDCHTIFSFFSRRIDTAKEPSCPKCDRPRLERQVSLFSISRGTRNSDDADLSGLDESKMERAMETLMREAQTMNEDDPRQAARMMRKLYDAMGLEPTAGVEEAVRRLEAGEDPESIEQDLGGVFESEDPFDLSTIKKALRRKTLPPAKDETLYEL